MAWRTSGLKKPVSWHLKKENPHAKKISSSLSICLYSGTAWDSSGDLACTNVSKTPSIHHPSIQNFFIQVVQQIRHLSLVYPKIDREMWTLSQQKSDVGGSGLAIYMARSRLGHYSQQSQRKRCVIYFFLVVRVTTMLVTRRIWRPSSLADVLEA